MVSAGSPRARAAATSVGAVGAVLPGVEVRGGAVAAPAPLRVRSPGLMTGYLDEPTPTLADGFVTRDLGYVADGHVYVVGRSDDVIITGGENVHPAAIEAALLALPGVAAAAVVGVPDDRWGERVAAAVVPGPGFDPDATARAIARWPAHQRPRPLAIVAALPTTAAGKIDRRAVGDHLRGRGAQLGSLARTPNAAR